MRTPLTTLVVVMAMLAVISCGQNSQGLRGGRRPFPPRVEAARAQREELLRRQEAQRRLEEYEIANNPIQKSNDPPSSDPVAEGDRLPSADLAEEKVTEERPASTAGPAADSRGEEGSPEATPTPSNQPLEAELKPETSKPQQDVEFDESTRSGDAEAGHQTGPDTSGSTSGQTVDRPGSPDEAADHTNAQVSDLATPVGNPEANFAEADAPAAAEALNTADAPAAGDTPNPAADTPGSVDATDAPSDADTLGPVDVPAADNIPAVAATPAAEVTPAVVDTPVVADAPSSADPSAVTPSPTVDDQPESPNVASPAKAADPPSVQTPPVPPSDSDRGSPTVNLRPSLEELVEEQRAITRVVLAQKTLVESKLKVAEDELITLRRAQQEWSTERDTLHTSVETVRNTLLAEKDDLAKEVEQLKQQLAASERKREEAEQALTSQPQAPQAPPASPPTPSAPPASPPPDDALPVEANKRARRTTPVVHPPAENRPETHVERMAREAGMTVEQYQYTQATGRAEGSVDEVGRTVDRIVQGYESSYDKAPEAVKQVVVPPQALDRLSKLEFLLNQLRQRVEETDSMCSKAFADSQKRLQLEKERSEAAERARGEINEHKARVTAAAVAQEEANKRIEAELNRAKREFEERVRAKEEEERRKIEAAELEKERAQETERRRLHKREEHLDEGKRRELRHLEAIRRAETDRVVEDEPRAADVPWGPIIAVGVFVVVALGVILFILMRGKKDHNRDVLATMSYEQLKKAESAPAAPFSSYAAPPPPRAVPAVPVAGYQDTTVIRGGPQPSAEGELRNRVLHWDRNSNV